ncbi:hypothetical protein ETI10_01640 [Macrococcoides goetzii]|nr:hypothetical protein [Macrococcus goetzii]TDM41816.1 hypothetical protein ETI10_01640 [Macrococcus goetzii]
MIKVGEVYQDKTTNKHYEVLNIFVGEIKMTDGDNEYYVSEEHFKLIFELPDYKQLYEQQKQQINSLKTEILIINNDAVNSGDEAQMEITGRVIEALENTIVDDWRVEE